MKLDRLQLIGMLSARPFNGEHWSVERHRSGGCSIKQPFRRFHVLSFFPEREVHVARAGLHGSRSSCFGPGDLGLYPAGEPEEVAWHGSRIDAIHIHISPELIARSSQNLLGQARRQITRRFQFRDDRLAEHAGALYELCREWPQDQGTADSVIQTIVEHLARHYSLPAPVRDQRVGRVQMSDLLDLMHGPASVDNDLASLARVTGLARSSLHRNFRQIMGCSPHDYLLRSRVEMSKSGLQAGARSMADIAIECGFFDQAHFNNAFRDRIGLTPTAYMDWFSQA